MALAPLLALLSWSCIAPTSREGGLFERFGVGPGADVPAEAAAVPTVPVSHAREFRGVWVATVANIDFPSRPGLSAEKQQAELVQVLDTMAMAGLNAILFQVRPEGDALYVSAHEPWSRFLTGQQGRDPGFDPLAFLIEQAHARNIEVHAWLNPYRARSQGEVAPVWPHMAAVWPQHAHRYGKHLWMDPGAPEVQDRLVEVIADLVQGYDLDGVHFDDYFYPYPIRGRDFPDQATYAAYQAAGGTMSRDDWRRDNVNRMVQRVSETVAGIDPSVRFGISPFGIYRPGQPAGIRGLDQYADIYADPVRWTKEGWLDYLAPQLYWPSTQPEHAYDALIEWWSTLPDNGQYTFAGNYLSQLGSTPDWSLDEYRVQLDQSYNFREQGSQGNIFFSYAPLAGDRQGVVGVLGQEFYGRPALTPPLRSATGFVAPPAVQRVEGSVDAVGEVEVTVRHAAPMKAWVVYREDGEGRYEVERILPASTERFVLPPGRWAVSAADRQGLESEGVLIDIGVDGA